MSPGGRAYPRLLLLAWFFLGAAVDAGHVNDAVDLFQLENPSTIPKLFDLCVGSLECSALYHQESLHPNQTLFRRLLPAVFPPAPISSVLRATDPSAESEKLAIAGLILARSEETPLCDVNHRPEFDADSLTARCVCKPGALCSTDAIYNLIPFYIAVGLVALAGIVFASFGIYKNVVLIRKLQDLEVKGTNAAAVLLAALS